MMIRVSVAVPRRIEWNPVRDFMLRRGLAQNAEMKNLFVLGTQIVGDFIPLDEDPTKALTHEQFLLIVRDLQQAFPGIGVAIDLR